jgi:hypothetical protein
LAHGADQRSAYAFATGVRTGVLITAMCSL